MPKLGSIVAWGIIGATMIVLGVLFHGMVSKNTMTTSDAIQGFLVGTLVLFTAYYAWQTANMSSEMTEQRLDSSRPLLVPISGQAGIAPALVSQRHELLLRIENIGLGPAINISARLERRSSDGSIDIKLNELVTAAKPLAAGSESLLNQWFNSSGLLYAIEDDSWLVVHYDDTFGRHFKTEARYIKESNTWVSIKIERVKKRPPTIRETKYYAKAGL